MVRHKYSLENGGEKRLVITHSLFFKNIKIWVDGEDIGRIPSLKVDSKEDFFILNDGSKLEIRLVKVHNFPPIVQLEIFRNNQPVPGSPTDPHQQVLEACKAIDLLIKFNLLIIAWLSFIVYVAIMETDGEEFVLTILSILLTLFFGVIIAFFINSKIKKLSKTALKIMIFLCIFSILDRNLFNVWVLYKILPALGAIDKLKQAGFTEYKQAYSPQSNAKISKTPKVKPNQNQSTSLSVDAAPETETSLKNYNFGNENSNFNQSNNHVYVEDMDFDITAENKAENLINETIINRMKKLNLQGYKLYKIAKFQSNSEQYYQAGEAYDHSYDSFWGDCIFAEKYDRYFFEKMGIFAQDVGAEQAKERAKKIMLHARESLVISCQCYLQALSLDPNHYWANLKLATALTASLQTNASLSYWKQALNLNKMDTSRAILADSMGFDYRSIAAKEVIHSLGLGGASPHFPPNFLHKQLLAQKLLCSNAYVAKKIPELRRK